jgi:phenylacetate-CoA ligase
MKKTFMPSFKNLDELNEYQLKGLQWTVSHAYNGSPFYKKRLDQANVAPEDIRSLEDIKRLPFVTADDLREGYPFPLLSVPESRVVRIHASSGSTGKRKVLTYTQKDIDDWIHFFARCYEMAGLTEADRVQIAVGYGIWTAGISFQTACEKFGAMAIPMGPGNIDMQCEVLQDLQSTVFCCTVSMGLLMAEEIHKRNLKDKIALKKVIFGSERSSEAVKARVKELTGAEDVFDITGMTELYGPGTGLDCPKHEGIHYWADYYILEILNPDTLEPVEPGEIGEMVVTTLRKEASPLIRYRTRDLTRWVAHPCSCGNILPLHDRLMGRSDDMIIFRAVNIYPRQIEEVLASCPEVGSEYQILLERKDDGREYMTVRAECCDGVDLSANAGLCEKIAHKIKKQIFVSAAVEAVDYCCLPRTDRKSKRVFDNRERV